MEEEKEEEEEGSGGGGRGKQDRKVTIATNARSSMPARDSKLYAKAMIGTAQRRLSAHRTAWKPETAASASSPGVAFTSEPPAPRDTAAANMAAVSRFRSPPKFATVYSA